MVERNHPDEAADDDPLAGLQRYLVQIYGTRPDGFYTAEELDEGIRNFQFWEQMLASDPGVRYLEVSDFLKAVTLLAWNEPSQADKTVQLIGVEWVEGIPSAIHLIGQGTSLLDEWYQEESRKVAGWVPPSWGDGASDAAVQLVRTATTGMARTTGPKFIEHYGWDVTVKATVLAIAGAVGAYETENRGATLVDACRALFPADPDDWWKQLPV